MKRENGYNLTHHFPFGERFDETLMKGYSISCQCIRLSNHHTPQQVHRGNGSTILACMPVCRQAIMPA
ncbi:hypothetical protein [Marseilla massiliensis]|uniref:hypothetical protein n=1 Tax=Marseilla massiliensis TaxID=1841864 RepID=UPI00201179A2|nr:hypothetical protein [Marseilla massiliensis]MCL1611602.1 hypothetical protein [Marseilla massiliensis]